MIVADDQPAARNAAVDPVAEVQPQVALMDLNMPGCDGVAATRITADYPATRAAGRSARADPSAIG